MFHRSCHLDSCHIAGRHLALSLPERLLSQSALWVDADEVESPIAEVDDETKMEVDAAEADDAEADYAEAEEDEDLPELSLDIFDVIKSAQAQHGLRHGDHARYRQYCSRRLHRIRKGLKFMHGKGRQVCLPPPVYPPPLHQPCP